MTEKRVRRTPLRSRGWLVLLPLWALLVLACAQGGTIVSTSTSSNHQAPKATALVLVGTQNGLFAYPVPDDGTSGQHRWTFPWPAPSCPACFFTVDNQSIFAVSGTTLTKLDAAGKVLAQVKLAGNALAAPIIMDQPDSVIVVTDQGLQETSASAPQPPTAPVSFAKTVSGTPLVASTAMYVSIAVGSELYVIDCNGQPQDSIKILGHTTLNGAAIGAPQFAKGSVLVPMASGVAAVTFQGDQGYGPERDIPWPGNGGVASAVAVASDGTGAYLASGSQLTQIDVSSGKLLRSTTLPGDLLSQLTVVGHRGYVATSHGIASWDDGGPLDPSNGPPIIWPHGFVVPRTPPPPPNAKLPVLLAATNTGALLAAIDGNDTVALRPLVVPPTHTAFTSDAPALSVGVLALG
jgi:outer membrane protein assembly factor BamB